MDADEALKFVELLNLQLGGNLWGVEACPLKPCLIITYLFYNNFKNFSVFAFWTG